ncbi:MAG: c-type cytochrome [Flavobacteriales bacterium]|nr:c-type cytochrome [Flavobacteriia bacterium]NCP05301.1 c-type cytochrome [Flavobacteriales bacterium]PIV93056.1 MAG: cytochrome C oxidase subunit III [Flavobacteriaceae bacterium CG17_big_fil_post_rev_8_21_14_2_50_33_15]PIY11860.1 MAG: cytochrome C oxidase subunit III [Flavobacteriaceae bacterium CG_4_10_14_3_um_filter_33_47]PJB18278.1 MAG: cytochrome C oxidase subunit III [Flavobacteriaceae bacterium CG_4_9_14_3_um_filter_33_16]
MRNLIPSYIRVPIVFFIIFGLVEYFVDSGDQPAFMKYPIIMLFLVLVLLILIAIEAIVGALENVMFQSLTEEGKERFLASKSKVPQFSWIQNIYKKLAGTKPIEEEHELILDHNYDGIKELDNSLPPWWIYSFYASIIFAAVYLVNFHILGNNSQFDEYAEEYKQAEISIAEYKKNAKDLVDINTVTLLTDVADLNSGKAIFMQNCVPCHMTDGGGGIGPNLTDNHWILGGGIKNVFNTITEGGRDGKGMISWKQNFKPSEIAQVASYVLSLQGTTPANPKAPEGDVWVDETVETPLETTTTEVDSLSTATN